MNITRNIIWINQNQNIPSAIMSDFVAREIVSKEVQKVLDEDKEEKIQEVRPVEEFEGMLKEDDSKEEINRQIRRLDIRG